VRRAEALGTATKADRVPSGAAGSRVFLIHEFIGSMVENRRPSARAYESIACTLPGIAIYQPALRVEESMSTPDRGKAPV
jgi:hypothetical protein